LLRHAASLHGSGSTSRSRTLTGRVVPLLSLSDDYQVVALPLADDLPLRSVRGLQQAMPMVRVLGVRPAGERGRFVSGPPSDVDLHAGDDVVVLADAEALEELLASQRPQA
jgi:Trk K+ transport system NAD-binding subunit